MTGKGTESSQAATEEFDQAVEAIRHGNRQQAAQHYQRSMELFDEESADDRAFKAFVAYQYGVCLLNMQNFEGVKIKDFTKSQQEAADQIRNLWRETLRLFSTLDESERDDFDGTFPYSHSSITKKILSDPLMKEDFLYFMYRQTEDLSKEGRKPEAIEILLKIIKNLHESNPNQRKMLLTVHSRLAALYIDTRNFQAAAEHAQWVLKNGALDDGQQTMMQFALDFAREHGARA